MLMCGTFSTAGVTLLKCCLPCLPRSTSHSESHWHCPRCPLKCTSRGRLKYHLNCHDQGTTRSLREEADIPGEADPPDTGQSDQGWHSDDNDELMSGEEDEAAEEVEGEEEDVEKMNPKEVCIVLFLLHCLEWSRRSDV